MRPELSIIMVSYNTRDITVRAIETLFENTPDTAFELIVWDNDSQDGSADLIAERFPEVRLIRSPDNIGFAAANNEVAKEAKGEWLLLLNPDTETHPGAIKNLLHFAKAHPEAGIVGGRTVFPDGSLNIASCWNRMTVWSLLCSATGLSRVLMNSSVFNPEAIGGWKRDSVRHVDIVVGCFFLIPAALWHELGGFQLRYFMYGEEADMCLRAAQLGYRPMITPEAQIMHMVGASAKKREDKLVRVLKAKATLVRDHWSPIKQPVGLALLWSMVGVRSAAQTILGSVTDGSGNAWRAAWRDRNDWLRGY